MSIKPKLRTGLVKTNLSLVLGIVVVLILACSNDSPMQPEPRPEGWVFMNLADKEIHRVRLFGDYLYACANRDGLFRINVKEDSAEWQYLGLADSTLPRGIDGVKDVAVLDNMILVAYSTPNPDDNGIFRAKVGEFDWQPAGDGVAGVSVLSPSPWDEETILAGTIAGLVFESTNFGLSWRQILNEITTAAVIRVIRFHPLRQNEIWVGGEWFDGAELWQSTDSGESWQDRHEIIDTLLVRQYGENVSIPQTLLEIAFDPADEEVMYLGSEWLWKSANGGETWAALDTPGVIWTIGINPSNSSEIIVSTGRHLSMTDNAGKKWKRISLPETNSVISYLEIDWKNQVLYTHIFSQELSSTVLGVYKLYF